MKMKYQRKIERDRAKRDARARVRNAQPSDDTLDDADDTTDATIDDDVEDLVARRVLGDDV